MIGAPEFFTALLILYLMECVVKVRADATVFQAGLRGQYKSASTRLLTGNGSWGWALSNPLRPDIASFACGPPPACLTASGILLPPQAKMDWRFCSFEELGDTRVEFASGAEKAIFLQRLSTLRKLAPKDRDKWVTKDLRSALDSDAIRGELQRFRCATQTVRRLSIAMALILFVFFPAAILLAGLGIAVLAAAALALSVSIWAAILYAGLLREYEPLQARLEKWGTLLHLALYPIAVVRCLDRFSLHLLARYETVAVTSVLCARRDVERAALRQLGELDAMAGAGGGDERTGMELRAYVTRTRPALIEFLKGMRIDAAALLRPPDCADQNCRSYCPICRVPYTVTEGECADCAVRLRPLISAATAREER